MKKLMQSLQTFALESARSSKPSRTRKQITAGVAAQIAALLNTNNQLLVRYDSSRVFKSRAVYLPVEKLGLVFGVVAVERKGFLITEIKHLVVHPSFRRLGLATHLVNKALGEIKTPVAMATIRQDNMASRSLFKTAGFVEVLVAPVKDHKVVLLLKKTCLE